MYNLNKRKYLLIFSTLYVIGMILCGFFQSLFPILCFNGVFTLGSIWTVYFLTRDKDNNNKVNDTCQEIIKIDEIKIEPKKEIKKTLPDKNDNVYVAEEISMEDIKRIKKEERTWYKESTQRIEEKLERMKNGYGLTREKQEK